VSKGQDILSKFKQQLETSKGTKEGRLQGLRKMAAFVEVSHDDDTRRIESHELQRIEDELYGEELQFICVKFSSLSRARDILADLSGYLLNKIQALSQAKSEATSPDKSKKRALHKQQLIKSAYRFVQNCQAEARQCVERSVQRMVYQLLSVQNGAYFALKMYRHGRIPSTTAIKVGLFERVADFLNLCSDFLREGDLQEVVKEMAVRFARHLQELLIGYSLKPPRVFREIEDVKYVVADYRECRKLFADFGLELKKIKPRKSGSIAESADSKESESKHADAAEDEESDVDDPFYPYTSCVAAMQKSTVSLMQQHMVSMALRNEQQKAERKKKEQEQGPNEAEAVSRSKSIRPWKGKKSRQHMKALSAISKKNEPNFKRKGIKDKVAIRSVYNDPILHILAHRADDEEAASYVENFVQYRHASRPLLIDLSNIENTLRVIIHEGKGLPALDFTGKSDPFCKVQLMPFKLKEQTRVVRQTLRPKWDEPLDFQVTQKGHRHIMIEIECWDWDTIGSDDFIGKHTERIEFGQENVVEKWIELFQSNNHSVAQGQLLISIECENLWNV